MTQRHLHIVAHDIPWPPDYGGVIDLFYKLKALHAQGVLIQLHCFTQGRPQQEELNKYCTSVKYYKREKNIFSLSFRLPFIVKSRKSRQLMNDLEKDNYPVLLEGIHCTFHLFTGELDNRKVFVRLHNIEFKYYLQLAKNEPRFLKKWYFLNESMLLRKYERLIANKAVFIAVNKLDATLYKSLFNLHHVHYLPVFIPYTLSICKSGMGCFCLYHGNLSINENEKAVTWLLQNVFHEIDIPLVIAGKDPSKKMMSIVHTHPNTCIVANPTEKEMQDLLGKAQVNILPSFNNTGVKLKLINAIFNGRHCIVNEQGAAGSGIESACHIATDAVSFCKLIHQLYLTEFTEQERECRNGLLQRLYNNDKNAITLATIIFGDN